LQEKSEEENTLDEIKHHLYRSARRLWQIIQLQQIEKGEAKYPEPLTPSSWTFKELVEHAVQENVDQMHYLMAIQIKCERMASENHFLKNENAILIAQVEQLKKESETR
jgi:hypothetical protein